MPALIRRFAALLMCAALSLSVIAAPRYVVDGDGDAVSDEVDDCPYTRPGTQVNAKGCPLRRDDADVDGIADEEDDCPYSAAGATVDAKGCALDGDFDGVPDGIDQCVRSGFALAVSLNGCAVGERPQQPASATSLAVMPTTAPQPQPAIIAAIQAAPAVEKRVSAEAPLLLLQFNADSMRLSENDLANISAYARIFARRLASNPSSKLQLLSYADLAETEAPTLAVGRMALVRKELLARGIVLDRIRAQNGTLGRGNPINNRRVEVRIAN